MTAAPAGAAPTEHRQEQKPAAEEDGGEELVLAVAEARAQHADKPQEGDSGEGPQVERHRNPTRIAPEPWYPLHGAVRDGEAEEQERQHQQQCE
jgi:hypothetical protein